MSGKMSHPTKILTSIDRNTWTDLALDGDKHFCLV